MSARRSHRAEPLRAHAAVASAHPDPGGVLVGGPYHDLLVQGPLSLSAAPAGPVPLDVVRRRGFERGPGSRVTGRSASGPDQQAAR